MADARLLAALDIGGTKIGWAVGTPEGQIVAHDRAPTDPAAPAESALERALEGIRQLAEEQGGELAALGVACPGPFLQPEGKFLEVPNLPGWQGFELAEFLRERWKLPFSAMNDANAGVLAEWRWGAAQGSDTALFLTMSTGMGAGFLLGGRVFEGPLGFAGEIGHVRLSPDGPVGFGKRGSVEGYLSGPGMVQVAQSEAQRHVQLGVETELGSDEITPRKLCELALANDAAALCAIDIIGAKLGELCALLVDLLNPDVIVLGTIGSAYPDLFVPRARAVIDAESIPLASGRVELVASGLSDRGNQSALAVACSALEDAERVSS